MDEACASPRGRQLFKLSSARHAAAARRLTPELPDMVFDLDMVAGLRRAGGDRRAYLDLLRRFGRNQRSFATQLRAPMARQDWSTAECVVHGCALAADRIGAHHLAARAQVLETALHERLDMGQLRPLVREVAALVQALAQQLHAQLAPDAARA
ncbi:hypothetical protein RD110_00380 [Rhodoferax koreense]|uniref:HPt domain-containing protein n=1 Tax=Rhodoferax koreensis TaxID=1842727 RepID=A0A1P8JQ25_9BURK|nr:hypothetical protein RD110_00380 [Rhodoferax koreense]